MPKKDLVGLKFGKLTVIKETDKRASNGSIVWLCKCDCGNLCERPGSNLTRKTLKNIYCGKCSNSENLIGQKFNHLTVIEQTNKRSNGKIVWSCQCDCGNPNLVNVSTSNLKNGSVKSCGCLNRNIKDQIFIDITNNKYNKLTVLKYLPNNKWKCQCDCGNIIEVTYSDLIHNRIRNCGNLTCTKHSSGEEILEQIFLNNNICYEKQKTFQSCRLPETKGLARFDFYLPDFNILIEYDGIQHFQEISIFDQSLVEVQKSDNYKNTWAQQNNIKLIRIPYYQKDLLNIQFIMNLINMEEE